jgi:two-component system, OmpR family, sensor histidine kinase BaeS
MTTLRTRLTAVVIAVSLLVAGVIVVAVVQFSAQQVMKMAMEAGQSEVAAQAMFDQYVLSVVLFGAAAGIVLGGLAAWWLVRRLMRPLEQLTLASRSIAVGDLAARVPEPPDPELRSLATAFNQMAATLERVEELRRALVEDVAHELRTPLTSLRGYTEALADGVVNPTPEMLRNIHEEIERLTRLVEGLDQLARGEATMRTRARVEVDLGAVVRRTLELVSPELASRQIDVRIEDGGDLPPLRADPDGIGQVVTNLVQNAARYTDDGGAITIRLEAERGRWLVCAVENTGSEIPERELPLIWERLHRVDRSRARVSGGAGIGLAIVRQIVRAHGGEVGASSAHGRTQVWFRLPLRSAA